MSNLSRRHFVVTAAAAAVLPARAAWAVRRAPIAQEIVDRIRANGGALAGKAPGDAFKAGDPATTITGVATTVMATTPVLQAAVARKQNLILTLEPVFYAANDVPGPRANDPVYLAKKELIERERLVVVRLGDPWNTKDPSAGPAALARAIGWNAGHLVRPDGVLVTGLNSTFGAVSAVVRKQLSIRGGLRTVGRAGMQVRSVFISPGTTDTARTIAILPSADVIVCGEPREWEAVPYAFDSWQTTRPKGLIALGRLVSEEPGMGACIAWLKSFITDVPVAHIPVADPYWSPAV